MAPRKDYNGYRIVAGTVSRLLASDLVVLLQQLGVSPTIRFDKRAGKHVIEGREVNVRDRYIIKVSGKYNLDRLGPVVGPIPAQTRSQRRAVSFPHTDSMMFIPIRSIDSIESECGVRDLQVEGTNKFFAGVGGVLVHNCGVQYAGSDSELRTMPDRFSMGRWTEYDDTAPFDGSICAKCYYADYNNTLDGLTTPLEHEFHV